MSSPDRKKVDRDLRAPGERPADDSGDAPGVPGFGSWRGVYWFVFGAFLAMVLGLTLFSRFHA